MLVPDEKAADLYATQIAPNLKDGDVLMFAHGFNIHYNQIQPPAEVDVIMVAPGTWSHGKKPASEGKGVPL